MQRGRSFKTGGIGSVSSNEKTFQLHSCLNLTSKTSGHKPQFASLLLPNHTIYVSLSDNSLLALLFSLVFLLFRLFSLRLLLLFSSSHHSLLSFPFAPPFLVLSYLFFPTFFLPFLFISLFSSSFPSFSFLATLSPLYWSLFLFIVFKPYTFFQLFPLRSSYFPFFSFQV